MESLTITFTDEEWAELTTAARRNNVAVERFAHEATMTAVRSRAAHEERLRRRDEQRRLMRAESMALMNDPQDRAETRRIYEQMQTYDPPWPE